MTARLIGGVAALALATAAGAEAQEHQFTMKLATWKDVSVNATAEIDWDPIPPTFEGWDYGDQDLFLKKFHPAWGSIIGGEFRGAVEGSVNWIASVEDLDYNTDSMLYHGYAGANAGRSFTLPGDRKLPPLEGWDTEEWLAVEHSQGPYSGSGSVNLSASVTTTDITGFLGLDKAKIESGYWTYVAAFPGWEATEASATGTLTAKASITYIYERDVDEPALPPADFNLNGQVDAFDLGVWQVHQGKSGNVGQNMGDADGDDDVDAFDYGIWQTAYYGGSSLAAIPEPATAALLGLTLVAGLCRRA